MVRIPSSCKVCSKRKKFNRFCRRHGISRGSVVCRLVLMNDRKALVSRGMV